MDSMRIFWLINLCLTDEVNPFRLVGNTSIHNGQEVVTRWSHHWVHWSLQTNKIPAILLHNGHGCKRYRSMVHGPTMRREGRGVCMKFYLLSRPPWKRETHDEFQPVIYLPLLNGSFVHPFKIVMMIQIVRTIHFHSQLGRNSMLKNQYP